MAAKSGYHIHILWTFLVVFCWIIVQQARSDGQDWNCEEMKSKSNKFAVLRPNDPQMFAGDNLTLCCMLLDQADHPVQVDSVHFSCVGRGVFSRPWRDASRSCAPRQAVCASLSDVMSPNQSGTCECRVGNESNGQLMKVYAMPPLQKTNCVYDDKTTLNCSLEFPWPPMQNTTTNITWMMAGGSCECTTSACRDKNKKCSSLDRCVLGPRQIKLNTLKCVYNISFYFTFGPEGKQRTTTSDVIRIDLDSISTMKPPRFGVKVADKSANCVRLKWQWQMPERILNPKARVDFRSASNKEWKTKYHHFMFNPINFDNHKNFTLCDLSPFSQYQLRVYFQPEKSQVWGEATDLTVNTLEDIPYWSPDVTKGAFASVSNHSVYVYWKAIPESGWNSNDSRAYQVFKSPNDSDWELVGTYSASDTEAEVAVLPGQLVYIGIYCRNKLGPSLNMSVLRVPSWNTRSSVPHVSVTFRNQEVTLSWNNSGKATVFWCHKGAKPYQCSNTIQWKFVGDRLNTTIPMADANEARRNMFGVSVDEQGSARDPSGVGLTSCITVIDEDGVSTDFECPTSLAARQAGDSSETSTLITVLTVLGAVGFIVFFGIATYYKCKKRRKLFKLPPVALFEVECVSSCESLGFTRIPSSSDSGNGPDFSRSTSQTDSNPNSTGYSRMVRNHQISIPNGHMPQVSGQSRSTDSGTTGFMTADTSRDSVGVEEARLGIDDRKGSVNEETKIDMKIVSEYHKNKNLNLKSKIEILQDVSSGDEEAEVRGHENGEDNDDTEEDDEDNGQSENDSSTSSEEEECCIEDENNSNQSWLRDHSLQHINPAFEDSFSDINGSS